MSTTNLAGRDELEGLHDLLGRVNVGVAGNHEGDELVKVNFLVISGSIAPQLLKRVFLNYLACGGGGVKLDNLHKIKSPQYVS